MSIRATCRITGAAKNTVTKLLVDLGDACSGYQHQTLVDPARRVECDEIWNFVYAKDKNIPAPPGRARYRQRLDMDRDLRRHEAHPRVVRGSAHRR